MDAGNWSVEEKFNSLPCETRRRLLKLRPAQPITNDDKCLMLEILERKQEYKTMKQLYAAK